MNKLNLNLSALTEITPPEVSVPSTASEFVTQLPQKANELTNNYFGLGIMVSLFFFLIWKLGEGRQLLNEKFTSIRSVGISAGVVSIIGLQAISLGYFSVYYHVVIFIGILLVCIIWVFLEDNK
jgi:hypothetical protein